MAKFDPNKADLNKDGKLSDYEENVGKKRAAAMKMDKKSRKIKKIEKTSKQIIDTPNPNYQNVSKKDSKKYYRKKEKFAKTVDQINSPMEKSPMYNYKKGYAMKMGSKEIDSPSAFNMKDAGNMAASPMMAYDPKTKVAIGPGAENYAGNQLEGVTVLSDPLFKHKKYKKALKTAQNEVSDAVLRKFSQDSARTGMTTGEYNNPYARYSVPQRSHYSAAKYNVDMATFGDRPGVAPRMYMTGKNLKSGTRNTDKSGYQTNRQDLIGKYNKMSKEMFSEKKKAIDLKFYGNK
jgi:hypothetical protein